LESIASKYCLNSPIQGTTAKRVGQLKIKRGDEKERKRQFGGEKPHTKERVEDLPVKIIAVLLQCQNYRSSKTVKEIQYGMEGKILPKQQKQKERYDEKRKDLVFQEGQQLRPYAI